MTHSFVINAHRQRSYLKQRYYDYYLYEKDTVKELMFCKSFLARSLAMMLGWKQRSLVIGVSVRNCLHHISTLPLLGSDIVLHGSTCL